MALTPEWRQAALAANQATELLLQIESRAQALRIKIEQSQKLDYYLRVAEGTPAEKDQADLAAAAVQEWLEVDLAEFLAGLAEVQAAAGPLVEVARKAVGQINGAREL